MQIKELIAEKEKQFGLDSTKWRDVFHNWARALQSYQTPLDVVIGTEWTKQEDEFYGQIFPFTHVEGKTYSQRRALMKKQKQYFPKKELRDYNFSFSPEECFLCQNVIQGIDATENSNISNNVMYDLGDYIIAPNRYPFEIGVSLLLPKSHDTNLELRVDSIREDSKKNKYPLIEGKTRGAIISPDFLSIMTKVCDQYHFGATRNHVLDAMSIPHHDHFHLIPEDLPYFNLSEFILNNKQPTDFGEGISYLQNTPFDTLAISAEKTENFHRRACSILEKMEKANQVFTLLYHNQNLLISPRRNGEKIANNIDVGAGVFSHVSFKEINQEYLDKIIKYIPRKGEYDWHRFM